MMKKKLLIVRPTMGHGGADRVTLNLLRYLNPESFEVELVLMRAEGAYIDEIPDHVQVIDTHTKNLWFYIFPLYRYFKKHRPDIVFSTCGGANMPLSLLAFLTRKRKYKLILSERNILFPPGKSRIKRTIMLLVKRFFYSFADVHTAVSQGVKEEMIDRFKLPEKDILVVDNPVITPDLAVKAEERVEHSWFKDTREVPVILHVGRFVYQKDHETLIHSFHELTKKRKARLVLLGEGPLRKQVESLIQNLGLEDQVYFGGFDKNPFKYMAKCDAFVLSSKHEGMPGVLIQAMACGAKCVSTDCRTGPNEIIKEELNNGMLVPVGDVQKMSKAIDDILSIELSDIKSSVSRFEMGPSVKTYLNAIEH
ncbi:MAG: glycosyltransferase [Bacteroidota bacterium]